MRVSHERLYQYIIEDKKRSGDKYNHLRRRKKYCKHIVLDDLRGKLVETNRFHIRGQEVEYRSCNEDNNIGLIVSTYYKGALLRINDRKSGFAEIKLLKRKDSKQVAKAIAKALLPH